MRKGILLRLHVDLFDKVTAAADRAGVSRNEWIVIQLLRAVSS